MCKQYFTAILAPKNSSKLAKMPVTKLIKIHFEVIFLMLVLFPIASSSAIIFVDAIFIPEHANVIANR